MESTGGGLGVQMCERGEVVDSTMNSLWVLSLAVNDQVNTQLGPGLDLKGNVGVDLFKDINSADLVDKRSFPTGIDVSITDASKLTDSDYQVEFVSAVTFRIRTSVVAWLAGTHTLDSPIAELGFSISGPADPSVTSYTVLPTRRAASGIAIDLDHADQLAFAAPMRAESELQNGGTGVIGQPYLIAGPSPIDKTVLGAANLSFDVTLSPDGKSYSLSDPLP